ncbi:hypothetical protein J6590_044556 [Homalodisca vitripennis]|nr:hypothetical protein J6590_044556 [Homalodisca vitripennis]
MEWEIRLSSENGKKVLAGSGMWQIPASRRSQSITIPGLLPGPPSYYTLPPNRSPSLTAAYGTSRSLGALSL